MTAKSGNSILEVNPIHGPNLQTPFPQTFEDSSTEITMACNKHRANDVYRGKQTHRAEFFACFGKHIEEFDSIKRAIACLSDASVVNYCHNLSHYFVYINENPDQVIANRRIDLKSDNCEDWERYERLTREYIKKLIEMGYAGRGIKGIKGRIGGFFKNNSKRYSLDFGRLTIPKARKRLKYSPTREEVRILYTFADSARDRLIILLMSQNGLAPVDISQIEVGDLPTEPWTYYEKSRNKTGECWSGVITPEISRELKTLLKQLESQGDNNGPTIGGKKLFMGRKHRPLDRVAISQLVQVLIEKSGLDENESFKPTALRDFFEDALVDANVQRKIKEALMGHTSEIEHEYGGHNRLVVRIVDAIKKSYPFLTLTGLPEGCEPSDNKFEELKERLEQRDVEMGKMIQEKNAEILQLQNELEKIKLLKPKLEVLLKRVGEIEATLNKQ